MSTSYLARRLVLAVITLWVASILVFAAVLALPGNAAQAILGKNATPERLAALTAQLNLDQSPVTRYGSWLAGIVRGNLGTSAATQEPVTKLLAGPLQNTLFLVVVAAVVAIPLSVAIGMYSGLRKNRLLDHVATAASLTLGAVPEFVIGIALILIFATGLLNILPAVSILEPDQSAWTEPQIIILPALALALAVSPYLIRLVRAQTIEALGSDYAMMAELKGVGQRRLLWRHIAPNAAGPLLQAIAAQLAWMAGGVVIIEYVFNFTGAGSTLVDAVTNRDLPVVQALALAGAAVYISLNLLADLAQIAVTPKLRSHA